ncbi:glycosylphosphatidylinositol anchor biosynthesis [Rhodosporidiobolus nylandii]
MMKCYEPGEARPPFRKVLYLRQPYPDNYVDTSFLSSLKRNVLASRLSSNTSVFALLLFATLWFGPFPLLRSSLPLKPTLILTWALASAALVGLRALEAPAATGMAAAAMFGTAVAAPVLRGALEARYKDRMSGPWDVVRPRVGAGARLLRIALELLRRKGTLVTLGNASGPVAPFAPLKLGPKNLKVCRPVLIQYVHTQSEYQTYANELFALIQSGELKLAVHGEDPLSARGSGMYRRTPPSPSRKTSRKLLSKVADAKAASVKSRVA